MGLKNHGVPGRRRSARVLNIYCERVMNSVDFDRLPGFCRREDVSSIIRALIAPILFLLPFARDFTNTEFYLYVIVLIALIGRANYLMHWHVHHPFTTAPAFNLLLDMCLGVATGMTASNWRIQHVYGHHFGADERFRAPVDMRRPYTPRAAFSFCLRSLWPTFFAPIREAFEKGVRRNEKSPVNYRWAFVEQCLLILLIAALLVWRPWLAIFYLLPWYVSVFFISRYVDYLNHYGCDESGANLPALANNTSHRWFNFLTGNFGYHTAHHLHPRAHWTQLPELHREISKDIPQAHLKNFSWSFLHLPHHFYLARLGRM